MKLGTRAALEASISIPSFTYNYLDYWKRTDAARVRADLNRLAADQNDDVSPGTLVDEPGSVVDGR